MERRCPRCQTLQRPTARFCRGCGAALEAPGADAPRPPVESASSVAPPERVAAALTPSTERPPLCSVSLETDASLPLTRTEDVSPEGRPVVLTERVVSVPWAEGAEAEEIADGLWRVEAAMVDLLLSLVITLAALAATATVKDTPTISQFGTVAAVALAGVFVINEWILIPLRGQSVGMMAVGLRLVGDAEHELTALRCLVRNTVGYLLSALPLGLGVLWIFIDAHHQGWHDKITRTKVVKARSHG
jgi:uncharacterized RDD family membrane protein YckC